MKIGIRGAGFMTRRIAETINQMGDDYELYALASRSLEKGQAFQEEYGFTKVYTDFEEMLNDPELDLVYVALTNQFHKETAIQCIDHGVAALVEKPFCLNYKETKEVFDYAEEKGVLVSEATWPNYAPARQIVDDVLKSGIVGKIQRAEVCMANNAGNDHAERFRNLQYGGGAIMEYSSYTIGSMIMAHYGMPEIVDAEFEYDEAGADIRDRIKLRYEDGPEVDIIHNATQPRPFVKYAKFFGENGMIEIDGTSNVTGGRVRDAEGNVIKEIEIPPMISGYEYEFMSCKKALDEGAIECPEQTHAASLHELQVNDELRRRAGIVFYCD